MSLQIFQPETMQREHLWATFIVATTITVHFQRSTWIACNMYADAASVSISPNKCDQNMKFSYLLQKCIPALKTGRVTGRTDIKTPNLFIG